MAVAAAAAVVSVLTLEIHHRNWAQPLLLLPLLAQVARCLALASLGLHFVNHGKGIVVAISQTRKLLAKIKSRNTCEKDKRIDQKFKTVSFREKKKNH
jgi:hypothetical protein